MNDITTPNAAGIGAIQVTEHMNFNIGNAVVHLWHGNDGDSTPQDAIVDLQKAVWFTMREIERRQALLETEKALMQLVPATKRRGRPPKALALPAPEPKRRGRPPKVAS